MGLERNDNYFHLETDRFVVHHKKSHYKGMMTLSIIMCLIITTVGLIILPDMIADREVVGILLAFGMAVLVGPVCGLVYARILKEEYLMLIDSQGITIRQTGLIPWEDIEDVIPYDSDFNLLGIKVRNEEKYLYGKSGPALAIYKINKPFIKAMFQITLRYAEESWMEVIPQIEKRWELHSDKPLSAYEKLCSFGSGSSLEHTLVYIDPTEYEKPIKSFTINKDRKNAIQEELQSRIDTDKQISSEEAKELRESIEDLDEYSDVYITSNGYLVVCLGKEDRSKWIIKLSGIANVVRKSENAFSITLKSSTDLIIFNESESCGLCGVIDIVDWNLYDIFESSLYETLLECCNS